MTGIRTACKCLLGLWIGCSLLPSASAQVGMMNYGSSHVGGISTGQHRIVGFQPASGVSNMPISNLYGNGVTFGQPIGGFSGMNSGSVVGFQPASSHSFGRTQSFGNFGGFNSGVATTGSQYGRMIRYQYRVPVYGRVSRCGTQASSCNSCGP